MKELIERLEKATGPDHELDDMIALAIGWTYRKMDRDRKPYWREPGNNDWFRRQQPPAYTSSIDAALTLVPEGAHWEIAGDKTAFIRIGDADVAGTWDAATPAIALCIAALRASEGEETQILREAEIPWLVETLGNSIAGLGYPVGMGQAPSDEHLHKAATKLFDRYAGMIAMASASEGEWRPIETAPKDASEILVYREDAGVMLARWIAPCDFMSEQELDLVDDAYANEADWFAADFIQGGRLSNDGLPTHWMPLPTPPRANDDHPSALKND